MSKSKQMFTEMRDQVQEWESRERVSSKTQDSTLILNELFSYFGEIFSDYEGRKKTTNEG